MIKRIHIKGYKSIKDQKISLNSINIIIGGNGVGKSNFISVFSFIKSIYEQKLASYVIRKGGSNNILYFGKKQTQDILLDLGFGTSRSDSSYNRFILKLANTQDSLYLNSVMTAFKSGKLWSGKLYEEDVRETSFKEIKSGQAYYLNQWLKSIRIYHFHDTGDNSPIKSVSNIDDNESLKSDGGNLASFLYFLKNKHPKHFYRIEKTIQSIAPFFDKFILEPSKLNEDIIKLKWKEVAYSDAYFDAYNLSDGTLRFMCLVTLLMQPTPPQTIIIDEPELGLHPIAINKLAALMRKAALNSQLIVSTQSVTFLNNFEAEDIIIADKKNNETVFKRLDKENLENWLQEYSIGDIWLKNIIGGQPFNS